MSNLAVTDLTVYQVDPMRGFLPNPDPLEYLPPGFEAWESVAPQVPALLTADRLRYTLEQLPIPDLRRLETEGELQRAMLLLSVFGNAYVWGGAQPASRLPASIAVPWWQIAEKLGRPPIVSHASIVLYNWRLLDKNGPLDLDNMAILQPFLGGMDEQWFYLVTAAIEASGAPALVALVNAQQAVAAGHEGGLTDNLKLIAAAVADMLDNLRRMPEKCAPYIFYHRVRPFLASWADPGLIYEGVSETPQKFIGGSAAQSSLVQALDAGLNVTHSAAETHSFLSLMRSYMPPAHRHFIEAVEVGPSIRQFVLDRQERYPTLSDLYNECLQILGNFRKKHIEIAVRYITHQAEHPDEAKGTGGTDFVPFLSAAHKETREQLIENET